LKTTGIILVIVGLAALLNLAACAADEEKSDVGTPQATPISKVHTINLVYKYVSCLGTNGLAPEEVERALVNKGIEVLEVRVPEGMIDMPICQACLSCSLTYKYEIIVEDVQQETAKAIIADMEVFLPFENEIIVIEPTPISAPTEEGLTIYFINDSNKTLNNLVVGGVTIGDLQSQETSGMIKYDAFRFDTGMPDEDASAEVKGETITNYERGYWCGTEKMSADTGEYTIFVNISEDYLILSCPNGPTIFA